MATATVGVDISNWLYLDANQTRTFRMNLGRLNAQAGYWDIRVYPSFVPALFNFDFHLEVVGMSFLGRTDGDAWLYYTVRNNLDQPVNFSRVALSVYEFG